MGPYEGAEPGVCGPYHRSLVFHGAKHGHAEMLVGGAGHTKPGIVCDVDKDVCSFSYEGPGQFREDGLKADEYSQ